MIVTSFCMLPQMAINDFCRSTELENGFYARLVLLIDDLARKSSVH